jgi:hypothetical protein
MKCPTVDIVLYIRPVPFRFAYVTARHSNVQIILWYDTIYLSTAIGFTPGGSSTVHIYTQTIQRLKHIITTTQITTNLEECGPCPIFASFTLAFDLQLRKKHGKISVRVAEECKRVLLYIETNCCENIPLQNMSEFMDIKNTSNCSFVWTRIPSLFSVRSVFIRLVYVWRSVASSVLLKWAGRRDFTTGPLWYKWV